MESISSPVSSPLPRPVPGLLSMSPTVPELVLPANPSAPQQRKQVSGTLRRGKRFKRLELERLEVEVRERRVRTETLEHQLLMTRMGALERFGPEDGDRAIAASLVRERLLNSSTKRPRCEDTSELPPAKRPR